MSASVASPKSVLIVVVTLQNSSSFSLQASKDIVTLLMKPSANQSTVTPSSDTLYSVAVHVPSNFFTALWFLLQATANKAIAAIIKIFFILIVFKFSPNIQKVYHLYIRGNTHSQNKKSSLACTRELHYITSKLY